MEAPMHGGETTSIVASHNAPKRPPLSRTVQAATTSLIKLIPDPGKHRQKGLWAKDAVALAHLGPDPAEMQRGDLAVPVGLVNLGSTCYVNAVLQTLYAIPPFRQALYAARPPLSQDPVVAQLRLAMEGDGHGREGLALETGSR